MSALWWKKKREGAEAAPAPAPASESPPQVSVVEGGSASSMAHEPAAKKPSSRKSWLARLSEGMARTRSGLTDRVKELFGGESPGLDEEDLEELESLLLAADCGPTASVELVEQLREAFEERSGITGEECLTFLKERLRERLGRERGPMRLDADPFSIILVVGVNGVGKTTTTAKLASIFQAYGHRVMLVAADTFRAGAIEQLCVWGQRLGADVVKGEAGADPSSVVYDALSAAKARGAGIVLIDTAGRLHTQKNLMEELGKIHRVIRKVVPGGPHETFLVLDATTGQNALSQADIFGSFVDISGLVVTKLDGTAKGGVLVALSDRLKVPVRFLGVGESVEDLNSFKPDEFVDALFQ